MWSSKIFVFVAILISFAVCTESTVICYYGTWATYRRGNGQYNVEHINPRLCTHLIYTFAGIDNYGRVISLDPELDLPFGRDNFRKFNSLKQRNPYLKTILGVGGWYEGSAKYSRMAADAGLRRNFIDSALNMVLTYGFDGLDIDWEYPNQRDTVHGRADIDNFTTLLREVRQAFNRYGLILSAGVAATEDSASQSYNIPAISQYLDFVNLMMYDMAGSWDPVTGHNAPLHLGSNSPYSVDRALRYWINAGCPREKIAMGLPFYTRTFALTYPHNNGPGAPSRGPGLAGPYTVAAGTMGYNEFCFKLRTEPWTWRYDNIARVPYAFKGADWVTYDDVDSIIAKINHAKSLGVRNFMVWSIETDDFHGLCGGGVNPLLTAINRVV